MPDITFASPYTQRGLDALKIGALYFDTIRLRQRKLFQVTPKDPGKPLHEGGIGVITDITPFVDELFIKQIKSLLDESIVIIEDEGKDALEEKLAKRLRELFRSNQGILFEETNVKYDEHGKKQSSLVKFVESDMRAVHEKYVGPFAVGETMDMGFLLQYYEGLLWDAVDAVLRGRTVISASKALQKFMLYCHTQDILKPGDINKVMPAVAEPKIVGDIFRAALLDVSKLEIEDILEARHSLKDELAAFRETVQQVQLEVTHKYSLDELVSQGDKIMEITMRPRLKEIEKKITSSKYGIFKKLLKVLRSPNAYVPFLGTAFLGLPIEIALFVSFGLMSVEAATEYLQEKRELKENGLMYLVRVRDKVNKK